MTPVSDARIRFVHAPPRRRAVGLCEAVAEGLAATPKRLPCRFFYDATGSQLFERICRLPEYYLTRTEHALLERHAGAIVAAAGPDLSFVEFGSGSSEKTRLLLQAALERQRHLHYVSIDISADFLRASALSLLEDFRGLTVTAVAAEYADGLAALPEETGPRLILFLGSNIGNFTDSEAVDFLADLRRTMQPRDRLLVGIDLEKDPNVIGPAYDDPAGITARFNKNILARVNRELGGNFDLDAFEHRAPYVESLARVEMRLVSLRRQTIRIEALESEWTVEQEEYIHTENSHKYSLERATGLFGDAGLIPEARWLDDRSWFAAVLLRPDD